MAPQFIASRFRSSPSRSSLIFLRQKRKKFAGSLAVLFLAETLEVL
jgi:hypothetical protein